MAKDDPVGIEPEEQVEVEEIDKETSEILSGIEGANVTVEGLRDYYAQKGEEYIAITERTAYPQKRCRCSSKINRRSKYYCNS